MTARAAPAAVIAPAGPDDLAAVADLFRAYVGWLGIDLAYQGFATELATLPGKYAPPRGALLIARDPAGTPLGCVALRPMADPALCEMKRLFVAPEARAAGLGRALATAVLTEARRLGYAGIRLDTLPTMTGAQRLYDSLGFERIAPYYDTPIRDTVFLGRDLG